MTDDPAALVGQERLRPAGEARVEEGEEARAIGVESRPVGGGDPRQRVADGRGDRPRIVRVEQVVRIAGIVDGALLAAPAGRRCGRRLMPFEQSSTAGPPGLRRGSFTRLQHAA